LRLRFKIALPTFIILSLIGFAGESANRNFNVKYYKETEWVKTNNPVEKDSKSFFYSFYFNVVIESLDVKPWSESYISYFNEKVRVKLILQVNSYRAQESIHMIINKSYIPRKSIEDYSISC
jgi:ABC-type transporter lipoprotein component MlaA